MVKLIIPSYNRAMQLDGLLRSIHRYASNIFDISIVYRISTPDFHKAYSLLSYPGVDFLLESDFRSDVLNLLDFEHVCFSAFCTDDMLFFRQVDRDSLFDSLPKEDNQCFSLRLGLNTIVQHEPENLLQDPLNVYFQNKNVITWNRKLYNPLFNYGYAFAFDMHVYCTSILRRLLKSFEWRNSNQIETGLFQYSHLIDYISSFDHSVSVNVPCNNISGVTSTDNSFSLEQLNKMFLDGYRIDLDKTFESVKVIGCHQQIKLEFAHEIQD